MPVLIYGENTGSPSAGLPVSFPTPKFLPWDVCFPTEPTCPPTP